METHQEYDELEISFQEDPNVVRKILKTSIWENATGRIGLTSALFIFSAIGASQTNDTFWWIFTFINGVFFCLAILPVISNKELPVKSRKITLVLEKDALQIFSDFSQSTVLWSDIYSHREISAHYLIESPDETLSSLLIPLNPTSTAFINEMNRRIERDRNLIENREE